MTNCLFAPLWLLCKHVSSLWYWACSPQPSAALAPHHLSPGLAAPAGYCAITCSQRTESSSRAEFKGWVPLAPVVEMCSYRDAAGKQETINTIQHAPFTSHTCCCQHIWVYFPHREYILLLRFNSINHCIWLRLGRVLTYVRGCRSERCCLGVALTYVRSGVLFRGGTDLWYWAVGLRCCLGVVLTYVRGCRSEVLFRGGTDLC